MKHKSLSKVLKRLACVLAALVIALAVAVFALWHKRAGHPLVPQKAL